jgi:hypothetical protein
MADRVERSRLARLSGAAVPRRDCCPPHAQQRPPRERGEAPETSPACGAWLSLLSSWPIKAARPTSAPLDRERAEGALVGARRAAPAAAPAAPRHLFSAAAPTSTGARRGFLLRSAAAAGAAAAPHDQDGETREMRRSRPAAGLPRQRRSPAALTAARSGLGSTAGPTACAAYEVLGAFIHSRSNLAFICWHGEICPPESKSLHGAASAEKRGQRRSVGLCVRARGLLLALTCSTLLATHTGQSQALRLGAGAAAN